MLNGRAMRGDQWTATRKSAMADMPAESSDIARTRAGRKRSSVAGIVALAALGIAAGAWFWTTRQPAQPDAGTGLQHGVIVVAAATFVVALIAQVRVMSLSDVLEMVLALIAGLFRL